MTPLRPGILVAALMVLASCERTEPPAGNGTTKASPSTAPAPAPATQSLREQMEQEAARTAEGAKKLAESVVEQIRARYEDHVQRELARVDEHIAQLQQKLASASEAARPAIEEQLRLWRERAATMQEKLAALHGAADETWLEVKKDLDAAISQVRQTLGPEPATVPATRPGQ